MRSATPKKLALAMLLAANSVVTWADNRLHINELVIEPGKEYTVSVLLENDVDITGIQAELQLSEGLEILQVENGGQMVKFIKNNVRLANHDLNGDGVNGKYKVMVTGTGVFAGESDGEVFNFVIRADENMSNDGIITITDQKLRTAEGNYVKPEAQNTTVKVQQPAIPSDLFISAEEAFTMRAVAETHTVTVSLANSFPVHAFEALVRVPEGMSIKNWVAKERTAGFSFFHQRQAYDPQLYKVLFATQNPTLVFKKDEGPVFDFEVEANNDLAAQSQIEILSVKVGDLYAKDTDLDGLTIDVTNPNAIAKAAADQLMNELGEAFQQAKDGVDPSVREDQKYTAETNDIVLAAEQVAQDAIDALQDAIDEAYEAGTLDMDNLTDLEAVAREKIADVVTVGEVAKQLLDQLTKNDEVYDALTPQFDELDEVVAAAKQHMEEYNPDVKDLFPFTEIDEEIETLKNGIEEKHNKPNRNLNDDDQAAAEEEIEAIKAKIQELVENADAAQEAFYQAQAEQMLEDGTAAAEEAIGAIREECEPFVTDEKQAVEDALAALKEAVESGAPYRESIEAITALKEALDEAIDNLVQAEQAAKDQLETAAKEQALADLQDLKDALEAEEAAADGNAYVQEPEVIKNIIDEAEEAAEAAVQAVEDFIAQEGRDEEADPAKEGDLADPEKAANLQQLIDDANAAIANIADKVDEVTARKDASQAAYDRLKPQVDALKEKYDDYVRRITLGDGHEVLDLPEIVEEKAAVDQMFDDLYEQLKNANEVEVSLDENSNIDQELQDLNDAIDQFIVDVDTKAKEMDHNAQRYAQLNRDLNDLQEKLDDAVEEVRSKENVGGLFEDQIAALQDRIDDLRTELDEKNAAHQLDLHTELEDFKPTSKAIDNLLKDAAAEEQAYKDNRADLEEKVENAGDAIDDLKDNQQALLEDCTYLDEEQKQAIQDALDAIDQAKQDLEDALAQADENKQLTDPEVLEQLNQAIEDLNQATEDAEKLIEDTKADYESHHQLGDVNEDLKVNVSDITFMVNALNSPATLPTKDSDPEQFDRLDVNGDQRINVADLSNVINLALNASDAREVSDVYVGEETLSASNTTVNGMLQQSLSLNSSRKYVAYQVDVILPAGTTLAAAELTERANGHVLNVIELGNNAYRMMVYSQTNASFKGTEGALLNVRVNGNGQAQFENAIFADRSATAYDFAVAGAQTVGISGVNAETGVKGAIYSMGGRVMNALKKGINIIRRNDGTTQKVIK
jgi:DNA repair exonuclease SbcCD ATPase subunit